MFVCCGKIVVEVSVLDYKAMGQKIREKRKGLKLTQEQLAERVDISVAFVGHIERGTKIPSVSTLYRISRAVGCLMDELIEQNTNIYETF